MLVCIRSLSHPISCSYEEAKIGKPKQDAHFISAALWDSCCFAAWGRNLQNKKKLRQLEEDDEEAKKTIALPTQQ